MITLQIIVIINEFNQHAAKYKVVSVQRNSQTKPNDETSHLAVKILQRTSSRVTVFPVNTLLKGLVET